MAKIGRNDPCPCGSGFKYKNCCERMARSMIARNTERAKKSKMLGPQGFQRCFLKLVKDAGDEGVDISCEDLEAMPKDEALYDVEKDSFHFEKVKMVKKTIIEPDKRLRFLKN